MFTKIYFSKVRENVSSLTFLHFFCSHDDATLEKYSNKMISTGRKIKGDYSAVPSWLHVNKGIVPDFLVADPKHSDVWEITGNIQLFLKLQGSS